MSESYPRFPHRDRTDESQIDKIVSNLIGDILGKVGGASTRLQKFTEEYKKVFENVSSNEKLTYIFLEGRILNMIKGPLTLYALNLNGQVLIDLTGLLEQYAIVYLSYLFKSLRSIQLFSEGQQLVDSILQKQFLDRLATHLITLGIWNKEDKNQIDDLEDKRNYVAHKNVKKVIDVTGSNKKVSVHEIDSAMSDFDVLPHIFLAIRLLFKLLDRIDLKTERHRIATELLQSRIGKEVDYFKYPTDDEK